MSVKKNFAYNGLLLVSQYVIPIIIFPYISRVFGVDAIGIVNWVDSTINYFILVSTLGLTLTGIREVARHKSNRGELNKVFSELLLIHILMTIIVLGVYLYIIFTYGKFKEYQSLYLVGISKLIFNIFLVEWFFRGIENFKFITIRTILIKLFYVLLIFILVKKKEDYVIYFALTCGLTVINALVNCWYARNYVSFSFKNLNLVRHLKPFLTVGFYLLLTSMYTTFNTTYLGIVSTASAVGAYTTALKVYTIILGVFSALNTVLMPRLSSLVVEKKQKDFDDLVEKSLTFVITFCFPIIVCGMSLAPHIIVLLSGFGYDSAIVCFRIILPLILIVGFAQIFSNQVLMSIKKDKEIAYISVLGAVIGIGLNLLLVKYYNEVGTSVTLLVSELLVTLCLYIMVRPILRLKKTGINLVFNLVMSVPYFFICVFVEKITHSSILILAYSFFISVVYFFVSQKLVIRNAIVLEQFDLISVRFNSEKL